MWFAKKVGCLPKHQLEENSVLPWERKGWLKIPLKTGSLTDLSPEPTLADLRVHMCTLENVKEVSLADGCVEDSRGHPGAAFTVSTGGQWAMGFLQ